MHLISRGVICDLRNGFASKNDGCSCTVASAAQIVDHSNRNCRRKQKTGDRVPLWPLAKVGRAIGRHKDNVHDLVGKTTETIAVRVVS